ncbi:MAG: energy-coupling factor ABC transporter ATP-binding protein [Clostridiales bacterium]|nr:energy-coupling factor ABC transporter ATP-binding protein [Clostridiales bacterium]
MEILKIRNLSFSYPSKEEKALSNLSFSVHAGEFLVLCGQSGCGKTTLLRLLKKELSPNGTKEGEIFFEGRTLEELEDYRSASEIGFVLQNPEMQIVTDKVSSELAFGLENLGVDQEEMRLRVGEMASYFGIEGLFRKQTGTLSGGQKQLLNLAAVMVLSPKILLLDEPTAQLDPIAASNFISALHKINRELGVTVILAEHRLEEVFPLADRVAVLEEGRLVCLDEPKAVCKNLGKHPLSCGFPAAVRIFSGLKGEGECPISVKEGRSFLRHFPPKSLLLPQEPQSGETALSLENAWFRYERQSPDILRGLNLKVYTGEFFSVLGGNGAGKTTMLKVLAGLCRAYRGKIKILGENIQKYKGGALHRHCVALLPQSVQTVFLRKTVEEDLRDICRVVGLPKEEIGKKAENVAEALGIRPLFSRHPYDLSGGEAQKCALAKVLLTEPRILLLDEPTKGMDAYAKREFGRILSALKKTGMTILMVTHDVEFAALVSDRCALFFDGELLSPSVPGRFFGHNRFYTTAARRISEGIFENAVTVEDVIKAGGGQP